MELPQVRSAPPRRQTDLLVRLLHVSVGGKDTMKAPFSKFFFFQEQEKRKIKLDTPSSFFFFFHVSMCISSEKELGNFESTDAGSHLRGSAFTLACAWIATGQTALELCIWAGEGQIHNSVYNIS